MEKEIESFIEQHPDWYLEGDELVAGFEFGSFVGVKELLEKLLLVIDSEDHHPSVTFSYNTVEIRTTTHDAGNKVTEKDLKLAKAISKVVS